MVDNGDQATAGAPAPAVTLRSVTKRFPGVVANDAVDFTALRGEVHALLGENGAGKSTLSNIITGLYRPDEGEIAIDGVPAVFRTPREALEAGIFMVHQHFRLVPVFTVAENVVLGDRHGVGSTTVLDRDAIIARVSELSERYGLGVDPRARVWQLSVGEQQRVEILKALYRDARILILDEPTAVLTPQEADALFVTLRTMASEGRTVIFISHKLHEVIAVSDRVTVLRGGRSVATVATEGSTARSLAALMVGREVEMVRADRPPIADDVVLRVEGVSALGDRGQQALRDVTFTIRAGEILAIAGVAGNGQRELAEAITGIRARTSGTVIAAGQTLASGDSRGAISAGVAHVPEDRLHTGVASSLPISANVVLKSYRTPGPSRGPFLQLGWIRRAATELIARFDVKAPGHATPARLLSGGNLQKVVLGREFAGAPKVLVAASPTRGLDVGAIEAVHGHLREAAARGMAVLLISEDLEEIRALADRIAVLYEGRIVGIVDGATAQVTELGLMMAGAAA
jgi:simple sugar transport system ATP-binding protein